MDAASKIAVALLVAGTAMIVGMAAISNSKTRVVQAYGVMSPCDGMYAVIVETNRGTVLVDANSENDPAAKELETQVLALSQDKRHAIVVPCAAFPPEPGIAL